VCPVCRTSHGSREILRHIRSKHPNETFSRDLLWYLRAQQCSRCRKILPLSGKGSLACEPSQSQIPTDTPPQERLAEGSAAGPSGWTNEHLQSVFFGYEEGKEAITQLINACLAGLLPDWEDMRASRLIPLLKKGGGVRPIAIGEVWMRLFSICALSECAGLGPSLAPLQVGVGIRGGAQCLGHAIRAGVSEHPDHVTLQLDFSNEFNKLNRNAMRNAVASRAPQLLKYVRWSYMQASPLRLAKVEDPLWSKAGVRQGDPCGPALFALSRMCYKQHPSGTVRFASSRI
jgi:hypothetical protein